VGPHFTFGYIENKDDVCYFNSKPRFRILDMIDSHGISKADMVYLNQHGRFRQVPFVKSMKEFDTVLNPGRRLQPMELFKYPFTVVVVGACWL